MKYSIIIPTIGRESLKTVLKGISECEGFEETKLEILVIFDGRPVDMELSNYIKGIHLFSTDRQVYAGGARNVGIELATGDILIFIGDNGVPDKNWLKGIVNFHKTNSKSDRGLLGKTTWKDETTFTEFLENGPQFDYKGIKKSGATWRHFYACNVSLKKSFLKKAKSEKPVANSLIQFNTNFTGWGFEDAEFGYQLEQKGFNLSYNERLVIYRLDTPNIDLVVAKTASSRTNAQIFEQLHPEVKILPRGLKKGLLKVLIIGASFLGTFSQKIKWWGQWKKAWIADK